MADVLCHPRRVERAMDEYVSRLQAIRRLMTLHFRGR